MALAAGRQPEGLLGWAAAAVDQQLASRRGSGLEIPANATIDRAPSVKSAPAMIDDALSGNWRGSTDGLDVTLSLLQRGTAIRGACVLLANGDKDRQTWRCTVSREPNGTLVMQLRSGDETLTGTAYLEDPLTMQLRLEGPSFPAREVVVRKDA